MISRSKVFAQTRKSRLKVRVREMHKDDLEYLCGMLSREARFVACMTNDVSSNQILFAIDAVSVVSPNIGYYLMYCVGYYETGKILKSIRRHIRKNQKGALK